MFQRFISRSSLVSLLRGQLVVRNFWFVFGRIHFCLSFQFQPRFSVSFSRFVYPAGW